MSSGQETLSDNTSWTEQMSKDLKLASDMYDSLMVLYHETNSKLDLALKKIEDLENSNSYLKQENEKLKASTSHGPHPPYVFKTCREEMIQYCRFY